MQRLPRSVAPVLDWLSTERAVVDGFTAKHVPGFGQMDSNLMRSARLQLAFYHRVFADGFQWPNVRYRALSRWILWSVDWFRASFAIAAISDQNTVKSLCLRMAMNNGMVFPSYIVLSKNDAEHLSNGRRSGKYH